MYRCRQFIFSEERHEGNGPEGTAESETVFTMTPKTAHNWLRKKAVALATAFFLKAIKGQVFDTLQ
jgi:hypothetical protein